MISSTPQQRARVSQQELRYLWVWVSLSATEAVQEVLLEGHPSKQYLEEIHRLLVDVQQRLLVSQAEVWAGRACARVCIARVRVGLHACGGPGLSREDENTWKVTAHPEGCGKNGGEEETASDDLGEAGMCLRSCSRFCLSLCGPGLCFCIYETRFLCGRGEEG